ncbi:MAG: hypothetical protein WBO17_11650, partial [Sphingorhabdus sp.]
MANPSLQILLVLSDPDSMPRWVSRLIERIGDSAELGICAIAKSVTSRRRTRSNFLFRLLYRLERTAWAEPVAAGPLPREGLVDDIPRVQMDDDETLHVLAPDVILDLSGNHGLDVSTA